MHLPDLVLSSQDAVFEVAIELTRLDRRLAQISTSLPLPADVDDVLEERVVSTPATQLFGVIGAVKVNLKEAIEALLETAQIDEVTLRQEFRKWEQGRRS